MQLSNSSASSSAALVPSWGARPVDIDDLSESEPARKKHKYNAAKLDSESDLDATPPDLMYTGSRTLLESLPPPSPEQLRQPSPVEAPSPPPLADEDPVDLLSPDSEGGEGEDFNYVYQYEPADDSCTRALVDASGEQIGGEESALAIIPPDKLVPGKPYLAVFLDGTAHPLAQKLYKVGLAR
jgi:hypothetical protein